MKREHIKEQFVVIPTPIIYCPFTADYVDIINNITVPNGGTTISDGYIRFGLTGSWQEIPFYSQASASAYYSILAPVHDITISFELNIYDNTNNPVFMLLPRNSQSYLTPIWCENGSINIKQGNYGSTSSAAYTNNVWNKITFTYSDTTIKIYVNGSVVITHTATYNSSASNCSSIRLGRNAWGTPSTYLNGGMKELKVWDTILTDEQIASL